MKNMPYHRKDIQFEYSLEGNNDSHYHVYTVLSLLNNLVANAVEAIKERESLV